MSEAATWPRIAIADWEYRRCDNGQFVFGADWEDFVHSIGEIIDDEPGVGYVLRYYEAILHRTLGPVWIVHHFSDQWNTHVCIAPGPVPFGPDPYADGSWSGWQPEYERLVGELGVDNLGLLSGGYASTLGAVKTEESVFQPGVWEETWARTIAGDDGAGFGGTEQWRSSASRNLGGGENSWTYIGEYVTSAQAGQASPWFRQLVRPSHAAGLEHLEQDEDYQTLPDHWWRNGLNFVDHDGGLTVIDGGVLFPNFTVGIQRNAANSMGFDYPIEYDVAIEHDPTIPIPISGSDLVWRPSGPLTTVRLLQASHEAVPAVLSGPAVAEPSDLESRVNLRVSVPGVIQRAQQIAEIWNNVGRVAVKIFVDPRFLEGDVPPFGGIGASVFSTPQNRLSLHGATRRIWLRVRYPRWRYWIPGPPLQVPPLRQFPRDDELAGQGSPRQYPLPRGQQHGYRQGWTTYL